MHLIEPIAFPVEVALTMVSGTEYKVNGAPMKIRTGVLSNIQLLKVPVGGVIHGEPEFGICGLQDVLLRLKTREDRFERRFCRRAGVCSCNERFIF